MFYIIKIFACSIFIISIFYNIFYPNNFTVSKCYLENINININDSHICHSVWLIMFSYLFISVSFAPSGSVTSYNPVIFYFIGAILSSIFYKEDNFDITKQLLPCLM